MTTLTIRGEVPKDVAAIETVIKSAFRDAPHTDHTEHLIPASLRNAGVLTVALVAEMDGNIVGHVAVSPVSISDGAKGWYGLGPLAVIPAMHRRGVGSQLMHESLKMLREQGAEGCVVLGEPAYYQRFGFKNEPGLVLPNVPADYFMALSFGPPVPCGLVSYHQAFGVST